ncbi:MAG: hypothetical protein NVSMB29_01360 [Candidatus Dormibacteria bacterium]
MDALAVRVPQPAVQVSADAVATVAFGAYTDAGPMRDGNEDACLVLPAAAPFPAHLLAVADGLGGHLAGEVASRLVVETLADTTRELSLQRPERWLRQAFHAANLAVYDHARDHPEAFNLQSTATALLIEAGQVTIGHVGDCRAYRVRDGVAEVFTTDHTRAMDMLRLRIITPEQAQGHPARSQLTRSLGAEIMVHVDVSRQPLQVGDTWVVCSDGVWSEVSRAEIVEAVADVHPDEGARRLAGFAVDREASDNVTVTVARIERLPDAVAERGRRWLPWS